MNQQQYAMLIIQLSALGQRSNAYDTLDREQLETVIYLFDEAKRAAEARLQSGSKVAEREEWPNG